MPRFIPSLMKKRRHDPPALPTNTTTTSDVDNSSGSTSVAPRTPYVVASSSTPPIKPPAENLVTTDGPFGIRTISDPANADIDIWFVHGLTGGRESTWTHANGTFTPDLVHTQFPTARIITYGYDADVVGLWKNASGEGLRGHGKALAYAISNSRSNETQRPIFFIVHSLGGLVAEQALLVCLEPGEPRLFSVAACAAGIIFMGTPHSGSYLADWGYTLARLLGWFRRANTEILSVLKQKSEVLKGVEEVFQRQLTPNGALNNVRIFCFYETLALEVVGFVVPEESAKMLPHPSDGIHANHMDMTRFTSPNDAGFIRIKGVLDDWIKETREHLAQESRAQAKDTTPPAALTFNNGSIKADIFQQGTGNAGRDINRGNVTNQSAGRDWINKDQKIYRNVRGKGTQDQDWSDTEE